MIREVHTTTDLEYSRAGGVSLCLDIHRPASETPVPGVLYFHGGGWARGSRRDAGLERLRPVAARGVAVVSVSYRLTDVATHPAQLIDARGALRWLRTHGAEYGLHTRRIGAWGASAGGWIALMLALTGERGDTRADAAAAWFPVTNLTTVAEERAAAALPLPPFMLGREVPDMAAGLLGLDSTADDLPLAREASPISHADRAAAPILLLHGSADGMVDCRQSLELHDAVLRAGGKSELMLLPGANHEDPAFHAPAVIAATAGFFAALL